jgi:holin (3TMs family)
MTIPILGDVIREIGGVVKELIPDADKRMEIQVRLAELADQADARETQLLVSQTEVNKIEASNSNLFVSGWRPFIGWVCGGTLAYTWVLAPIAQATFHLQALPIVPPDQIYPIVMALLGLGTMRTYEKTKGVASDNTLPTTIPTLPKGPKGLGKIIPSWLR